MYICIYIKNGSLNIYLDSRLGVMALRGNSENRASAVSWLHAFVSCFTVTWLHGVTLAGCNAGPWLIVQNFVVTWWPSCYNYKWGV